MTAYMQTLIRETMITWESCSRCDDTFCKISQRLAGLKGRARRILTLNTTVQERFPRIMREPLVHLAAVSTHQTSWIVRRRRNHSQHIARSRIDGNNTADFTLEQTFAQGLQLDIQSQRQVLSSHRFLVEFTILIATLNSAVSISQHNLHTLLTTQLLLIKLLYTQFSDIVASLIVVIVFNIALRNLTHITQHMGCIRIGIFSDGTFLDIETGESEHLLLEHTEIPVAQLPHKKLLSIARIARVLRAVLDIVHSLDKKLFRNTQRITEIHRIKPAALLVHDHHQIVRRLIIHQQLTITVVNGTTSRKLNTLQEGITVGILLVVVAHNLKRKQTNHVNDHNSYGHSTDNESTFFKIVIQHTLLYIAN